MRVVLFSLRAAPAGLGQGRAGPRPRDDPPAGAAGGWSGRVAAGKTPPLPCVFHCLSWLRHRPLLAVLRCWPATSGRITSGTSPLTRILPQRRPRGEGFSVQRVCLPALLSCLLACLLARSLLPAFCFRLCDCIDSSGFTAPAVRYIISFEAGEPFDAGGLQLVKCVVVGQSFVLHQIRKMIGLAVHIATGRAPPEVQSAALSAARVPTPMAPGLGLQVCAITPSPPGQRTCLRTAVAIPIAEIPIAEMSRDSNHSISDAAGYRSSTRRSSKPTTRSSATSTSTRRKSAGRPVSRGRFVPRFGLIHVSVRRLSISIPSCWSRGGCWRTRLGVSHASHLSSVSC